MKWSGLQKSVSKFMPKIFYEIGPRWKTFIANFRITVPSTIKNVTLGKNLWQNTSKFSDRGFPQLFVN
jgi:hypothetical protein